jgi:hypothetical protein
MNSARQSPSVLVFKTVLERFPLTRLLNWLILVTGTFLGVSGVAGRPMQLIVAVPVQHVQLARSFAVTFDVMHFEQVVWQELHATGQALPLLPLE